MSSGSVMTSVCSRSKIYTPNLLWALSFLSQKQCDERAAVAGIGTIRGPAFFVRSRPRQAGEEESRSRIVKRLTGKKTTVNTVSTANCSENLLFSTP